MGRIGGAWGNVRTRRRRAGGSASARPHLRRASHPIASNFLADRCTHLAAMVAYYALLSLIPFLFLVLSFIGWFGEPSESSS